MLNYTYPLFRPPSEAKSLIIQITNGCSYNRCSFCGMYLNKRFYLKSFDEIKDEIDSLPDGYKRSTRRIFLADGDAAIYPTKGLIRILDYLDETFVNLERISAYAGWSCFEQKSVAEWEALRARKLTLLYFGLESGNNEVLNDVMNKKMDAERIKPLAKSIQSIGIKLSVTAILGGGGVALSRQHALDTATWISEVNPAYFSLLTIFLKRKKDYFDRIGKPSIKNLLDEAKLMIENISGTGIVFRSNHISNLFMLKGTLSEDKRDVLNQLQAAEEFLKRNNLLDAYPDYYAEGFSG